MSNPSVENVYTRQAAKELTKKYFWKLLGMMAIVVGIVYAITLGGAFLLALAGNETIMMVGYLVLMAVMLLVGCGLGIGLTAAMIDLCRGDETVTVGRVFSRMGQSVKALGLSLWVFLKTMLWALPVYAVAAIAAMLILSIANGTSVQTNETAATLMMLLPVIIMIVVFALVIPAAFRYMLSTYVLADKPETGVFECVNQSKAMMKGHKWQAFKLIIPIFLVMYVIMMVVMMVFTFVLTALSDAVAVAAIMSIVMFVVIMGLALYYSIRMELCYTLFYLKRSEEQNPAEAPAEEPAQAE